MEIRKSTLEDLPRIMEIYAYAREFMARTGNPNQWGPRKWPPESLIREDIAAGKSYVLECEADSANSEEVAFEREKSSECSPVIANHTGSKRIAAVFFYNVGDDPTYDVIEDGEWVGRSPYGVVHRIATDGSVRGAGKYCINWCFEQCGHLRIDTHADNKVMQKTLRTLGFTYCGIIHVYEDNDPRLAFEKVTAKAEEK